MRQRLWAQEQLDLARILFTANPVDRRERQLIRAREEMLRTLQALASGGIHKHPNATESTDAIIAFFENLSGMAGKTSGGIQVEG